MQRHKQRKKSFPTKDFNPPPLWPPSHANPFPTNPEQECSYKYCRHCDHEILSLQNLRKTTCPHHPSVFEKIEDSKLVHVQLIESYKESWQRVFQSLSEVKDTIWLGPSIGSFRGAIHPLLSQATQRNLFIFSWNCLQWRFRWPRRFICNAFSVLQMLQMSFHTFEPVVHSPEALQHRPQIWVQRPSG